MRQQPSRRAASAGTSMIEVLITVVILAFGLIGLAGLLLQGFGLNNASYLRSVATQQAYDMGDRIRANVAGATAGNYDSITYTANQNCGACTNCTVINLATFDACEWNKENETLLPLGRGNVSRNGAEFVITVSWDSNKDGAVNTGDTGYTLRLQP